MNFFFDIGTSAVLIAEVDIHVRPRIARADLVKISGSLQADSTPGTVRCIPRVLPHYEGNSAASDRKAVKSNRELGWLAVARGFSTVDFLLSTANLIFLQPLAQPSQRLSFSSGGPWQGAKSHLGQPEALPQGRMSTIIPDHERSKPLSLHGVSGGSCLCAN